MPLIVAALLSSLSISSASSALAVEASPSATRVHPECRSTAKHARAAWEHYATWADTQGCAVFDERGRIDLVASSRTCAMDPLQSAMLDARVSTAVELGQLAIEGARTRGRVPVVRRLRLARRDARIEGRGRDVWIHGDVHGTGALELVTQWGAGRGRARLVACAHAPDGTSRPIARMSAGRRGRGEAKMVRSSLAIDSPAVVTVEVSGRDRQRHRAYRVGLRHRPDDASARPEAVGQTAELVHGYADLHGVQMSAVGRALLTDSGPASASPSALAMHAGQLRQAYASGLRILVATARDRGMSNSSGHADVEATARASATDFDVIRLQLRAMHAFAARNDWYAIATDPAQARRIIASGRLAVVLATESSQPLASQHGDWRDQLDELRNLGVRVFHLADGRDNAFVGHARQAEPSEGGTDATRRVRNLVGLTELGRELIVELTRRKMLIPLDGVSRPAREDIYGLVSDRDHAAYAARELLLGRTRPDKLGHYPLLFTHTTFASLLATPQWLAMRDPSLIDPGFERALEAQLASEATAMDDEVGWIRSTGGVLGLGFHALAARTVADSGLPNDCPASSQTFAQLVAYGEQRFGIALAFGSGVGLSARPARVGIDSPRCRGVEALAPSAGGGAFDRGPEMISELGASGLDTNGLVSSAEAFLRMWERTYRAHRGPLDSQAYARRMRDPLRKHRPAM